MKKYWEGKWEVRECATLGTLFADVYRDGKLFAREMNRRLAEYFAANPTMFSRPFVDTAKGMTYLIESDVAATMFLKRGE